MKIISLCSLLTLISLNVSAEDIPVSNVTELVAAIGDADPGDVIILASGNYDIASNVSCLSNGAENNPITVRSETLGSAVINFDAVEGFKVLGTYWTFENLEIHGVCADDSACEHAFHIKGTADGTHIRNNKVEGFNAHIKGGGTNDTPRKFSDDVIIEYNEFYSQSPRQTSNPVTPIDVVGGKRWRVSHNYIHDFQKARGNNISYAAFLKGNSSDGIFSHNLVLCQNLHQGGVRVGLSFGGGGTGTQFCEDGSCQTEHRNGIMANNIIANCSDVGIYINKGANIQILNNTLFNTSGIDIRFDASRATVRNNLLDGRIRERNGGVATLSNNIEQGDLVSWFTDAPNLDFSLIDGSAFVDKGEMIAIINDDFCLSPRKDNYDIGAIEYAGERCDSTSPFHRSDKKTSNNDVGPTVTDMGNPSDSGSQPNKKDTGTILGTHLKDDASEEAGCACSTRKQSKSNWIVFALLGLFIFRRKHKSTDGYFG